MRSVNLGRLPFIVSLVAISLVVGMVPASAAIDPGDFTIRQRDIPIAGDDPGIGGGSVGCGKGKRVVTGGAFWHREGEGPDVGLDAYLASSAPMPNGRRWFAAGVSWVNEDLLLRVVAYCLPASAVGDYVVRRAVRTFLQNDVKAKDLRCGTGRRIVTGGAFWHQPGGPPDPAVHAYLRSSTPDGDGKGWYAVGDGREPELRFTVIALCLPTASVGRYTRRTMDVPVNADAPGGDDLSCGAGKRAVPGGAFWHFEGGGRHPSHRAWLKASVPEAGGERWYADGWNTQDARLLRIVALCRPA